MVAKDNTYLEKLKEQEEVIAKQQREIERLKRQKVEGINLVNLLIILKNLDKFTYEVLADNLEWYFNTVYRVLQVAEEWSAN